MPALFTKFDPQAFLENEKRQGAPAKVAKAAKVDAERSETVATLATLAGHATKSENQPVRNAVVTDLLPFRNPCAGIGAAKPAKPAKVGPFDPANGRADWSAEDWRARFDERAGFLEYDGGLLLDEAEVQAFEHCIVEWLSANPISSPAGRCAWCRKAERSSATVVPFGAAEHHAWLHTECWPAWHQWRREGAAIALRRMGIAICGFLGDHNE